MISDFVVSLVKSKLLLDVWLLFRLEAKFSVIRNPVNKQQSRRQSSRLRGARRLLRGGGGKV